MAINTIFLPPETQYAEIAYQTRGVVRQIPFHYTELPFFAAYGMKAAFKINMKFLIFLAFTVLGFFMVHPDLVCANAASEQADVVYQQVSQPPADQPALVAEAASIEAPVPPPGIPLSPVIAPYHDNHVALRAVERNIDLFANTIRERFALYLSRSGQYIELMKGILRQKDVPEDIVFLSLIESGFNPHAYSVARAAGPWQFISSTARRYGLEITWWKDERRDPVKSTGAAADYLKDLYNMFGSWNLAMAAYNAGEGKILKALRKSKADSYWELLQTRHIKSETKEYVPRFIAASLIASNPQDYGFTDIEYHPPLAYDEVEITSPIDLQVAAECAGVTIEEIRILNPEIRRWCTPPDVSSYILRIPQGTTERFLEKLASLPEEERFTVDRYTVKQGDTFSRIAKKTGIPVPVILSLNSYERVIPLKAGQTIYLPPKKLFALDREDRALLKKAVAKKRSGPKTKSGIRKVSGKSRLTPKNPKKA